MSGLAHGASAAVPHGVVPRRIVRQEDGSQYRRLYYWRLMAHRTRHLVRTLIEPTSNHNPYYTYARIFADFYQPLLDLWHGAPAEEEGELSAEEENLQAVLDSVEVDEFGAIVATTASSSSSVKQKAKKKRKRKEKSSHRSGATAKHRRDEGYDDDDDDEGSPEGLLDALWSAYEAIDPSPRLLGFAVHRLLWDVPFHLPLYAIAVAPTALLSVIALAACLCGCCGCGCGCPLHRPRKKGHHHRTTHRQRCLQLLCGCLALALLVAVAVALCAAVFLLPILFTGYIDDLVPSDHRLVVASFSY